MRAIEGFSLKKEWRAEAAVPFLYNRKGTFLLYKKGRSAVDAHSRGRQILPDGNRVRRGCASRHTLFYKNRKELEP